MCNGKAIQNTMAVSAALKGINCELFDINSKKREREREKEKIQYLERAARKFRHPEY